MRALASLTLLGLLAAVPAAAQVPPTTPVTTATGSTYHLTPGDVIRVSVWEHQEFSGQFEVDETGTIAYPVLGDIDVRNVTVAELRERLRQGLATLLNQPFVTVTPLFRIAILGEIVKPGLYTVDPTVSVIDVVALAGGPTPDANLNKILLLRGGHQQAMSLEREITHGSLETIGVRSGDQILVARKSLTKSDIGLLLNIGQFVLTVGLFIYTAQK
jgi:protein involved in polysaccharide export with SLBB domain